MIPDDVSCLKECAAVQIKSLLSREGPNMTEDEEDAIDDGFVLCDLNVIRNKYLAWRRLFPRLRPFFALKCNPDPMVASVLGQLGSGFDCASVPEILLALSSTDHNQSSLIYANPQRAEKDLETALQANVRTLTFDGAEELHKVHRAHHKLVEQHRLRHQHRHHHGHDDPSAASLPTPPSPPDMVLRILVPDKSSTVPLGEKFGVPQDQIEPLARLAHELRLPIVGISFHCGSGNHDPGAYRMAIDLAFDAARTVERIYNEWPSPSSSSSPDGTEHRCRLIDIGGGFPGRDGCGADAGRFVGHRGGNGSSDGFDADDAEEKDAETALKISEAVVPLIEERCPIGPPTGDGGGGDSADFQFIAEPGRYFVEAAFALCSRIYRVKVEAGGGSSSQPHRHYFIGQGVQGLFKDCILCGESFLPVPYAMDEGREAADPVPCTIHGPSGEDYDVVCRDYPLPPLEVGDWLLFDRMGAYTLSIAARSGRPAIRYVMGASPLPSSPGTGTNRR
jgi:ornithine decarboxylase